VPPAHGEPRNELLAPVVPQDATAAAVPFFVEAVLTSDNGGICVIGWVDDSASPLGPLRISTPLWRIVLDATTLVRTRRADVETSLGKPIAHRFGFMGFVHVGKPIPAGSACVVQAWLENGAQMQVQSACRPMTDLELRNVLLTRLADAEFDGNPGVERIACLDGGFGDQVIAFNRAITGRLVASPYIERFGPKRRPKASIVVALYGKSHYLPAQNALFSGRPGIEDYEFVYVSNSPELGETLTREARIGSLVYGVQQTVVLLPGNAGFGAANNAAAAVAGSDRILNVNPDVFPRDPDWAAKHTALVEAGGEGARLFGVPLYYDDGSLMHGGMYFEADDVISMAGGAMRRRRVLRVEHYGKGAPPEDSPFLSPRPVPAVTGAFISSARDWFERLGGFTEDFVFGHYEDADLCLKSLEAGVPSWLQDIRLWHFEQFNLPFDAFRWVPLQCAMLL
jgi:GT2 family glycosyltransferase